MKTKLMLSLFLLCLLVGWQQVPAQAGVTTHFVAAAANCGGATPCYDSIQAAVEAATDGDTVKIAAGTYTINTAPPAPLVSLTKPVNLLGGYSSSDWETADYQNNKTILDAQTVYNRRVLNVNVSSSAPFTIAGLTIQGGNGDGLINFDGGGILWQTGNGMLRYNLFQNNEANHGGGLYLVQGNVTISDNRFEQNQAVRGAGMWVNGATRLAISGNHFSDNEARTGAGALLTGQIDFVDNVLQNNSASNSALFIGQLDANSLAPQITVERNLFTGNEGEFGGALSLYDGETAVLDNQFTDNHGRFGGAIYIYSTQTSTLHNNLFTNNFAQVGSGQANGSSAIYAYQGTVELNGNQYYDNRTSLFDRSPADVIGIFLAEVTATNEIIANSVDSDGDNSGVYAAIRVEKGQLSGQHLTLVNNAEFAVRNEEGFVTISNSIIGSHETAAFEGNITSTTNLFHNVTPCTPSASCTDSLSGDPLFAAPTSNDFHIASLSPAVDAAVGSTVLLDFEGEKRPSGVAADLGADEYACGAPVLDLRMTNASEENGMLSGTLQWTPDESATTQAIRYASQRLSNLNWEGATLLVDSLAGDAASYTFTMPFDGSPIYFALDYETDCGEAAVSNNAFWPRYDQFLPLVIR